MNYERAALCRDRIRAVESLMQKQKAISTSFSDRDVIAVMPHDADAMADAALHSRRPHDRLRILHARAARATTPMGEALTQFMLQYYSAENLPPHGDPAAAASRRSADVIEELLGETGAAARIPERADARRQGEAGAHGDEKREGHMPEAG